MAIITKDTPYSSTVITADTHHPLCWGAVLAGAVAALSAHLLITLFGIGLGVQLIDPVSDAEPAEKFSIGVGIVWSVSALLSLWIGGWVAGRLTPEPNRRLARLHGVLVWSLATVIMAFVVTSSAGALVGGVAKLTGKTLAVAGQAGGAALGASGDAVKKIVTDNGDLLGSFAQEIAPDTANGANANTGSSNQIRPGARREISWALVRFFSLDRDARSAEARDALVKAIAANGGLSEADASRRVDEWIASYDRVQDDLKQLAERAEKKAREAADATADYLTHVAVWTFIAFLVGAISAACGGSCGAKCRRENDVNSVA
jgi:hypothetical protein